MGKRHHRGGKSGVVGGKKQKLIPKSTEPITSETKKCPTCGGDVNVLVKDGHPEAKAKITAEIWNNLPPEKPDILAHLREVRKGKKTICLLGTSPDNCNLAPWGEGLDMWAVNDAHRLGFMEGKMGNITGWFQMHHRWRFMATKQIPGSERMRYGMDHWNFIRDESLKFPIYMQKKYEDVPRSVEYPLREVAEALLYKKIGRGKFWQKKYFTCTFAYMAAFVCWAHDTEEGKKFFGHNGWDRVELYGVQLAQQVEYMMQKPSTEFWLGMMIARGIEVYVPENGYLLSGETYGYRNPHGNPSLGQIDEDNVGYWDWGDGVPDWGFRDKMTWG